MMTSLIPHGLTFIFGAPTRARAAVASLIAGDCGEGGTGLLWNTGDDLGSVEARQRALNFPRGQVEVHIADALFNVNTEGGSFADRLEPHAVGVIDSAVLPGLGLPAKPKLMEAQIRQYLHIVEKTQAAVVVFVDAPYASRVSVPPILGRLASAVYVFREDRDDSQEDEGDVYRLHALKPPRHGINSVRMTVAACLTENGEWTERAEWMDACALSAQAPREDVKALVFEYLMKALSNGAVMKTELFEAAKEDHGFYDALLHATRKAHADKIRSQKLNGTGWWFRSDVDGDRLGSAPPAQERTFTKYPGGERRWPSELRIERILPPLRPHASGLPSTNTVVDARQGCSTGPIKHGAQDGEVTKLAMGAPPQAWRFDEVDLDAFSQRLVLKDDGTAPSEGEWRKWAVLSARSYFSESGRQLDEDGLMAFVKACRAFASELPDLSEDDGYPEQHASNASGNGEGSTASSAGPEVGAAHKFTDHDDPVKLQAFVAYAIEECTQRYLVTAHLCKDGKESTQLRLDIAREFLVEATGSADGFEGLAQRMEEVSRKPQ